MDQLPWGNGEPASPALNPANEVSHHHEKRKIPNFMTLDRQGGCEQLVYSVSDWEPEGHLEAASPTGETEA